MSELLSRIPRDLANIVELVLKHNHWRDVETINMIASENQMSPLATILYLNDMMHRYAEGKPYKRYYQGLKYIDEMEVITIKLMGCLLYTSPSPRDLSTSRMPSSA